MSPGPVPAPAPEVTVIQITNIPGDPTPYAIKLNVYGPKYEDPVYTVFSINNIESYPSSTESIELDKKFWYSIYSDPTVVSVYIKEYSYSSWDFCGGISTDNGNTTLTVASNFLQTMSFSYNSLSNPD